MAYKIVIRRNSDDRIHVCPGFLGKFSEFWWSEGNGACDCNRKVIFDRVSDPESPRYDPDIYPCGETEYSVLEARLPDGKIYRFEDQLGNKADA